MASSPSPSGAISAILRSIASCHDDPDALLNAAKQMDRINRDEYVREGFLAKKLAVLTGYTSRCIVDAARALLLPHGIFLEILESEYGLYEQAIFSEDAWLADFAPDACYFCVGADHLDFQDAGAEIARWRALWEKTQRFLGCEVVQNTFEEPLHPVFGSLEVKWPASAGNYVRTVNLELARQALPFVHFVDVNGLAAYHGRKNWRDERLYDLAKIPVSYPHLLHYARGLAAVMTGLFGRSRKCLIVDLDNTLWGGTIGDDGLSALAVGDDTPVGAAYKRFQTYVKALKDRGVILAVCSKNEDANAREPFLKRDDMTLSLDDFSSFTANWDPKPDNIAKIARDLNIGLDAIVFVDDDDAECESVRQRLPEVAVIRLPEDPAEFVSAVAHSGFFEPVSVSREDLQRTQHYRTEERRKALLDGSGDHASFLRSLGMRASLGSFDQANLGRIAQLINKTNQFNLTTRRYGEAEISRMAADAASVTRYVKLRDRFGDNGLISAFIGFRKQDALAIDSWVMSCRVLKRQVERLLFREIVDEALRLKLRRIEGAYIPTAKNKLVENLLGELGFVAAGRQEDGSSRWTFDLSDSTALERLRNEEISIERTPAGE